MIERECLECKGPLLVYLSDKRKTCSTKCMGKIQSRRQFGSSNPNWKGGSSSKEGVSRYNKRYRKTHRTGCIICKRLCYGKVCRGCRGVLERKKINLICKWCNKDFSVIPAKKDQQYCLKDCYDKAQDKKIKKTCQKCSNSFSVPPCYKYQKYCTIRCRDGSKIGEDNPNWKGGKTPLNHEIRTSKEYRLWREAVFERDGYSCTCCNKVGGYREVHHKNPFSNILLRNNINSVKEAKICKELWKINNGITVCVDCHTDIDEYRFGGNVK